MNETSQILIPPQGGTALVSTDGKIPTLITALGDAGHFVWKEFFGAHLRNRHTRAAYMHAVTQFMNWMEARGIELHRISPGDVGAYMDSMTGGILKKKLHLAAIRRFCDLLCTRHILILNPAASCRGERYTPEGKTPEISKSHARTLLDSISTDRPAGLRDKCIIAILIFTAARAGAVAGLRIRDFAFDGTQYVLRFMEKNGRDRKIPCRNDVAELLLSYLQMIDASNESKDAPLFRSISGRTGQLTTTPIRNIDICRMVKRRLKDASLPDTLSPHSFRVCTITDLLTQGVPLEDVQFLAGHADARVTRLYDRRQKSVTRHTVERISI